MTQLQPSAQEMRALSTFGRGFRLLLGVVSIFLGLAIGVWVLYNSLIERHPSYSGGFLTFGISPVMIACGVYWLRTAYAGEMPILPNEEDANEEDWSKDGYQEW